MHLHDFWFLLIAFLWTGYFILEGFDFGVGVLIKLLARDEPERRVLLNTIGPVWDGNEVWMIAAGAATFAAFPGWYATMFSGFDLLLFAVLVCLIVRAVGFEYRVKRDSLRWKRNWAHAIFWCSLLAPLLWGLVFANLVHGVAVDQRHVYTGGLSGLFNPYALLGALTLLAVFTAHGAVFVALKTVGDIRDRARALALRLGALAALPVAAFLVWTQVDRGNSRSLATVVLALTAWVIALACTRTRREGWAFTFSAATVAATAATLFLALYPDVMPSTLNPGWSLTVTNASSSAYTLGIMTWVGAVFAPLVIGYQAWTYWVFRKRIGTRNIPQANFHGPSHVQGTVMTLAPVPDKPRILIVGGGYVGLYTAMRLLKKLNRGEATVTVVDPRSYMTYLPFLPEAAAGNVAPRNLVAPLRSVLTGAEVVTGHVVSVDQADKVAHVRTAAGDALELPFDHLVVALGSVSRTFPISGLAEHGIGMKSVEEAISLRNHVLAELDRADSTTDEAVKRKALTFVFVGGGFAGVETIAEVEDMVRDAARTYHNVSVEDMRFILVEAAGRILPEMGADLGVWTMEKLQERGIEVYLETSMESCVDQHVVLANGVETDASTIVWTAGVRPNPALAHFGLPLGPRGHVDTRPTLQVRGLDHVWAAGDNAQVPDLAGEEGAWCPPNAQHAVRQAPVLADNVIAALRGRSPKEYRHRNLGAVAGLGLHKGVAILFNKVKLKGRPAWWFHRLYHGSRVPTLNRKIRVFVDWLLASLLKRETVGLIELEHPRDPFTEAVTPSLSTPSRQ
jgi:cytochrome bd-type quinol oxidase subunit 2/NADH dehydrogenase FAD-containing subunit